MSSEEYCSALVPEGYVGNNLDIDDTCYSNYHDCAGVCDGDAVLESYYLDEDGDGLGVGDQIIICNDLIPDGLVNNNDDIDDNCYSNIIDGCGICDGDGSICTGCMDAEAFNYNCYAGELPPCNHNILIDDESCIYYPEEFEFNQSQMQAFYIIENAGIESDEVEELESFMDWVGVFKGDICVGSYPWIGNQTTIPSMGNDGTLLTADYLENGDFPTFKIYDSSEGKYINTNVNILTIAGQEYTGWINFGFYFIEDMLGLNIPIVFDQFVDILEDQEINISLIGSDPNNDPITFMIVETPQNGILSTNGDNVWIYKPYSHYFGLDYFTFSASDGNLTSNIGTVSINIESINDPPILEEVENQFIEEGSIFTYELSAYDVEQDFLIYNAIYDGDEILIDINGNMLNIYSIDENYNGSVNIIIEVTDGTDVVSTNFFLTFTPINDPPEIISMPPMLELWVGETFSYQIIVSDVDNDEFSYSLIEYPEGMNIDSLGLITWTPVEGIESVPITVLVSDGDESNAGIDMQEFNLTVYPYMITMNWQFDSRTDLISYLGIPGDSTITTVLEPLGSNVQGMIGEGSAALLGENGIWYGSLIEIEPTAGYWVILKNLQDYDVIDYTIEAYPTDINIQYNLHERLNLISYVGGDGLELDAALPDDIEMNIQSILTAGSAAIRDADSNWIGSLTEWNTLTGYWVDVFIDGDMSTHDILSFSFVNEHDSNEGLSRSKLTKKINKINEKLPIEFQYLQSTSQAFYFFDRISIDGLDASSGEWIIAYKEDVIIGAREWNGDVIDVPVMGYDGYPETESYCMNGDMPEFKLYSPTSGKIIDLEGEFSTWSNNLTTFSGSLKNVVIIPENFQLGNPYPNPFNPVTTISYAIPVDSEIELSIYDIQGRLIEQFISGYSKAGFYTVQWNPINVSSGVYFIRMIHSNDTIVKKLIFMK